MVTDVSDADVLAWFTGRVPTEWTTSGPLTIDVDDEEIIVTVAIPLPELAADAEDSTVRQAADGRAAAWRQETRETRIGIAREAQHRFGRTVSWAASVGGHTSLFTHLAVPVMTRLRQSERQVLDTLVAAGVAKSRSGALRWCVSLVSTHTQDWLGDLRSAIDQVRAVREQGPTD